MNPAEVVPVANRLRRAKRGKLELMENYMHTSDLNTDRLVSDLKRVVRDSEELLQATAGAVGDKAQEVRERLGEALESARRSCRGLEEKAIEGAQAADRTIREYPYQSMGIAFGVGLLLGVLVTRK